MTGSRHAPEPAAFGLVHVLCVLSLILGGGLMVARSTPAPTPAASALSGVADDFRVLADAGTAPPVGAGPLPALTLAAQQRIGEIGGDRRLTIVGRRELGGEHEGVVVLLPGAELVLDDFVLRGAIVSADSLARSPSGAREFVRVRGSLRIDPLDELPGLAVHVPGGSFETLGESARFQIDGDVVVGAFDVHAGSGSVLGRVATADGEDALVRGDLARRDGPARDDAPAWSVALEPASAPRVPGPQLPPAPPTDWDDVEALLAFDPSGLPLESDR